MKVGVLRWDLEWLLRAWSGQIGCGAVVRLGSRVVRLGPSERLRWGVVAAGLEWSDWVWSG